MPHKEDILQEHTVVSQINDLQAATNASELLLRAGPFASSHVYARHPVIATFEKRSRSFLGHARNSRLLKVLKLHESRVWQSQGFGCPSRARAAPMQRAVCMPVATDRSGLQK